LNAARRALGSHLVDVVSSSASPMSLAHPLEASPSSPFRKMMKIIPQGSAELITVFRTCAIGIGSIYVPTYLCLIYGSFSPSKQPQYQQDKFPEAILHHIHMRPTGLDTPRQRSISHQIESREIDVCSKLLSEIEPLVPTVSRSIWLDAILTGADLLCANGGWWLQWLNS
jgi:hypothetical protein